MTEKAICKLCGEPMPEGEEMFNYHGYSCDCPKPPLKKEKYEITDGHAEEAELDRRGISPQQVFGDEEEKMIKTSTPGYKVWLEILKLYDVKVKISDGADRIDAISLINKAIEEAEKFGIERGMYDTLNSNQEHLSPNEVGIIEQRGYNRGFKAGFKANDKPLEIERGKKLEL